MSQRMIQRSGVRKERRREETAKGRTLTPRPPRGLWHQGREDDLGIELDRSRSVERWRSGEVEHRGERPQDVSHHRRAEGVASSLSLVEDKLRRLIRR